MCSIIVGLNPIQTNPEFTKDVFSIYCPKLKEWAYDQTNALKWEEFVRVCNSKINIGHWQDDWQQAFSYAVAHYICITEPQYNQSVGEDAASGGVMSSRSIGNISYTYELDKTMAQHDAYKFWARTGYGVQLVNMSLSRGYVGIVMAK